MNDDVRTLSQSLRRSAELRPDAPLFVVRADNADDDDDATASFESTTYRSARRASLRHRRFVEGRVSNAALRAAASAAAAGKKAAKEDDVDAVVAYLSGNSPDLLASVVGCADASSLSSSDSYDDDGASGGGSPAENRIVPAMLNARWTSAEIASSLSVPTTTPPPPPPPARPPGENDAVGGGESGARRLHLTLILYGRGHERKALEAAGRINSAAAVSRHFAWAEPLPLFCADDDPDLASDDDDDGSEGDDNRDACRRKTERRSGEEGEEDAVILFTSGTSSSLGRPKGVRLSHRSLLVQAYAKTLPPCLYDCDTRMLASTVPFFHVGGLSSALAVTMAGGSLAFPESENGGTTPGGSFRPETVLSALESPSRAAAAAPTTTTTTSTKRADDGGGTANTLVVVPAMIHSLVRAVGDSDAASGKNAPSSRRYPTVRLVLVGGQNLDRRQHSSAKRLFPNARFVQTYACTEAGSSVTFRDLDVRRDDDDANVGDRMDRRRLEGECVGGAPWHVELGIFRRTEGGWSRDDAGRRAERLGPYRIGLIGTRGPHSMNGYWIRGSRRSPKGPSRTGAGVHGDGWILTNDLGYVDRGGDLYFCGRAGDVIRTGGETVFAPEVEGVLLRHPSVDLCAAFALPDERFGEAVCAAVVLAANKSSPDAPSPGNDEALVETLRKHCVDQQLAGYKRPRRVFVLDALPCNSAGKVLKYKLKEMFGNHKDRGTRELRDLPRRRSKL